VINVYTLINEYNDGWWYFKIALPIVLCIYLVLNILLSVRLLKINRFLKTSIILLLSNMFLYLPPLFIKVKNPEIQGEIDDVNIFCANLLSWQAGVTIEQNIHLIICLTLLFLAISFFIVGMIAKRRADIPSGSRRKI